LDFRLGIVATLSLRFCGRKIRNQIVGVKNRPQVEEKFIVLDSADDRRTGLAKFFGDGVGAEFLVLDGDDDSG
jgi:hypothetical protein